MLRFKKGGVRHCRAAVMEERLMHRDATLDRQSDKNGSSDYYKEIRYFLWLGAMQPEGIIVCISKFYMWALVGPWILQLYLAILKELRENHKVDAKPPCGFTLSQFSFLLIRSFPCTIFCIYFSHPTTFIKNIAGAATISYFLGYLPEVRGIPYQQLPY